MRTNKGSIGLPGAIIIAGAIVAIAIIWTQRPAGGYNIEPKTPQVALKAVGMAAVTNADHILGNPDAPIKLVEYSDPSCPYCKIFNTTMTRLMDVYGPGGKVAWVYRQFPLDKPGPGGQILHPNSGAQAEAFECAASQGGNTAFFAYEKRWFEVFPLEGAERRPADEDRKQIIQTAKDVGLDMASFTACLGSGKFKDKIERQYTDGINAEITGTPHTIMITPSGTRIPLSGLVDYATLKSSIDALIADIPAN